MTPTWLPFIRCSNWWGWGAGFAEYKNGCEGISWKAGVEVRRGSAFWVNGLGGSETLCAIAGVDSCAQSDLEPRLPTLSDERAWLNGNLLWNGL